MEHRNSTTAEANKQPALLPLPSQWLFIGWVFDLIVMPAQADQIKANNNNNLELGSSWKSGLAPAGNDFAIWNASVATPQRYGAVGDANNHFYLVQIQKANSR